MRSILGPSTISESQYSYLILYYGKVCVNVSLTLKKFYERNGKWKSTGIKPVEQKKKLFDEEEGKKCCQKLVMKFIIKYHGK